MSKSLQSITNFDELLDFLRDELDWPVEDYEFDDLVFEYDVDELGLKPEEAAKLKGGKIRQLRPLAGSQPFGIFFVEFGKKRLPIVVLRRILSQLVIKKRANAAESKRWNAADLLFISAFGEEDHREIAFAHFHEEPDTAELPVLRVLGWDGTDTPLKLEYVEQQLKHRLNWPEDTADQDVWREQWQAAFRHRPGYVIKTASALAGTLAEFARRIRDAAATIIEHESEEKGHLRRLHKGFRDALIHDLSEADFADTYAQTVTYGLLTAAVSRTDRDGEEGTALITQNITDMVPVTSPFLKEMLGEFLKAGGRKGSIDFDELGIQDVVELLRNRERTDLDAVLQDFGNKKQDKDPVIHFYEHFLASYNKKLRIQRGVFYTPQPVVSYIVRSVHELLQTEFGLEDGLASTVTWGEMVKRNEDLKLPPLTDEEKEKKTISPDEPFVQILDPATGTATFPVMVIDVIHKHLKEKWDKSGLATMPDLHGLPKDAPVPKTFEDYWQHYVPLGLLPRLYGYELMMAPYAIAHMKIGLKLHETGYKFLSEQRAQIYLTNALEPKMTQLPQIGFDALAHEAEAVNEIKWYKRFTVVIGNPPYSGHSKNNQLPWIVDKVHDYKRGLADLQKPGQAKWLQDDYVKFFRITEVIINQSEVGVIGMITNHRFLNNPTFRGLRRSLGNSFRCLRFLDLHGNTKAREKNDLISEDQNVFDIQQGVSISVLTAGFGESGTSYGELWGNRESKYAALQKNSVRSSSFEKLIPVPEYYLFIRQDACLRKEYEKGFLIHDAMRENGDPAPGIVTTQDEFAIAFTKSEMQDKVISLLETQTEEQARELFRLCTQSQWNYANAKRELKNGNWVDDIEPILYRPFDMRWTVFNQHVSVHRRLRVMRHLRAWKNLAIVTTRSVEIGRGFEHIFCTRGLIQHHTVSLKEVNFVIPLYLRPDPDELGFTKDETFNFSPAFLTHIATSLRLQKSDTGLPQGLTPEDIFHYIYAVFHSPGYRSRYAEFLKINFPRLPLTESLELFRELARIGGELVALHLLESPKLDEPITEFIGENTQVSKVIYTHENEGTVWIDGKGSKKNPQAGTSGFAPVPEAVWNFHIGGYQVCEKWLKDRGPKKGKPGRILSADDIAHYHKIVIALTETIRLMAEIDKVIEAHGGWPEAFNQASENG